MEILECLQKDHDAIRELMIELQTSEKSFEHNRRLFLEFAGLVESHAKAEEFVILSWALTQPDLELRGLAMESFEEHDLAEELANSIRRTLNEGMWKAKVNVYCDLIEHQLNEKHRELWPEIFDRVSEGERQGMGQTYHRNRQVSRAPSRKSKAASAMSVLDEAGRVPFALAWALGVPAWILLIVLMIRGH